MLVVGYTGNFTCAVWYGNDDYSPTNRMTGGSLLAQTGTTSCSRRIGASRSKSGASAPARAADAGCLRSHMAASNVEASDIEAGPAADPPSAVRIFWCAWKDARRGRQGRGKSHTWRSGETRQAGIIKRDRIPG
jgi:membrane peptidoglycan carboxypeptidase